MTRGRKKKLGERRHLHIDPYVYPNTDARMDKFIQWYDAVPAGDRTKMAMDLLIAAVNGELGVASTVSLRVEEAERAQKALESLLANMAIDE